MVTALNSGSGALAGVIVLCSCASRDKPLSTQVHEWVPANLVLMGNPAIDKHHILGRGGDTLCRFMLLKPG